METISSEIRPGLALRDSDLDAETAAYLRGRLRVYYRVIAASAVSMYVLGHVSWLIAGSWSLSEVFSPGPLVHLLACVTACGILVLLAVHRCTGQQLRGLDAVGLYVTMATLLTVYATEYRSGFQLLVGILALVIVMRAVVIPSSARLTMVMSLPAAAGVLAVQLAHGSTYTAAGEEVTVRSIFLNQMIWNQTTILFGVAVATVASRVNFSLRTKIVEARRLGQYRLEEKIGQGGMGEVYRATHAMLRRPTAVKLLRPDLTGEETIKRFRREVRETSRLTSPCTISIYDYGQTADGLFYYAMEYLDGVDVGEMIERTGAMPAGRVLHLLRQVCRSLAEAHAMGLIHRDVKPGNIMVCRRGGEFDVVKVVDFGLVKDLVDTEGSLTQIGAICGTPETLAPEVINGEPATGSADIYALGIVAYLMATGTRVFEAKAPLGLIRHHLDTVPESPSARNPGIPEDLDAVILRCLAKTPRERFESPVALRRALDACRDAGSWTDEDAAAWWSANSPKPDAP